MVKCCRGLRKGTHLLRLKPGNLGVEVVHLLLLNITELQHWPEAGSPLFLDLLLKAPGARCFVVIQCMEGSLVVPFPSHVTGLAHACGRPCEGDLACHHVQSTRHCN